MTNQTRKTYRLGGSPAGFTRLCTLTLGAILAIGGVAAISAQDQPAAAKSATQVEKKPAEPAIKMVGPYEVHQSIEVGGRYTHSYGSQPMWDTLFNQTSGGRILDQSLEMRSTNTSKSFFFDNLSMFSTGYGGDPINVSRLSLSKGRIYDFNGSFRRDRNYFDYNLLDNSLLGPLALVPEGHSLHAFNTVRRNSDANLTLLPLSMFSIRLGFNHGTNEGPTLTSVHNGGDVLEAQWFRNSRNTLLAGVDFKPFKRTTLSYDQFLVYYRGDSTFGVTGNTWQVGQFTAAPPAMTGSGVFESLGIDTLSTATCGSGTSKTAEISGGLANSFCSGTAVQSQVAPTRNKFPTEQFRFASNYWDKFAFHARLLYSDGSGNVNNFNETFTGLNSRTGQRQVIETGALPNNNLANNKRINLNGDADVEAELSKRVEFTDAVSYWKFRLTGNSTYAEQIWAGAGSNMLTPLGSLTPTTTTASASGFLNQSIAGNTAMVSVTVLPQLKLMGGWRFRSRTIGDPHVSNEAWNENSALAGAVIQSGRAFRVNINYDNLISAYSSGSAVNGEATGTPALTSANTFTRIAPDKAYHVRARATIVASNWLTFNITGNDYSGKNDDPLVNHIERNHDFSFGATMQPSEKFNLDVNYAYDSVFAQTYLCYLWTPPTGYSASVPFGATNAGPCVASASNPQGAAGLFQGSGTYNAPSNFFAGNLSYAPSRLVKLSFGSRLNNNSGSAEQLNPLMAPGALRSTYLVPFADVLFNISSEWAWHGNFVYDEYSENGPWGSLAARNVHGNVLTLGVKYAF